MNSYTHMKMIDQIKLIALSIVLTACSTQKSTEETAERKSEDPAAETSSKKEKKKIILFFGDSITAGYQLDMENAFPALIQKRIDSLGLDYTAINAGLSGETTAGGKSRINWVLRTVPDIFFLELGANDGLRGLPLEETPKNLQAIIDEVKKVNPEVKLLIAGMMVPPNLGKEYTDQFQQVFSNLADENQAELIPFLLDGVAGIPELNLSDGIHTTPEGHKIVMETVWNHLMPML